MGLQQGEAVNFDWKWYYSASGLAIWLVLLLALAIPKANRDIRVLLILVPLAIVKVLWWLFMRFAGMNSADMQEFTLIFHSMAVGIAVLWLVAKYPGRFGGFVRFLTFFGILMVVTSLGILSFSTEFSNETAVFLVLFVLMALTILVAITLSRRLCGGKYRPVCFMLWLALWIVLGSSVALGGFIIVASLILGGPSFSEAIWTLVLGGLMLGSCLYVLNLPFMILGFVHPFFRERLCACLGLKPMLAPAVPEVALGGTDVQNAKPQAP